jgi:galactokinase
MFVIKTAVAGLGMLDADPRMAELFGAVFGAPPAAVERAPARINLLGEHTDYNDGFVLPAPLPYFTTVSIGPGLEPGMLDGHSSRFGGARRPLKRLPQGDWLDYVAGCAAVLRQRRTRIESVRVTIESDIPIGAGISSSAALQVANLRALDRWLGLHLEDEEIARLAHRAEAEYVGAPCRIMDQLASALGRPGQAMFLDLRDLSRELLPLPSGCAIAVVHSGVSPELGASGYDERRADCRAAAEALGVSKLRDIGIADLRSVEALPDPLGRRARHIVTENNRVLEAATALRHGDLTAVGTLMVESHCSQRDDYDVSVPAVDALVEAALRHGAVGARLTGDGFGGPVVALLNGHPIWDWWPRVARDCPDAWLVYPSLAGAGSGRRRAG